MEGWIDSLYNYLERRGGFEYTWMNNILTFAEELGVQPDWISNMDSPKDILIAGGGPIIPERVLYNSSESKFRKKKNGVGKVVMVDPNDIIEGHLHQNMDNGFEFYFASLQEYLDFSDASELYDLITLFNLPIINTALLSKTVDQIGSIHKALKKGGKLIATGGFPTLYVEQITEEFSQRIRPIIQNRFDILTVKHLIDGEWRYDGQHLRIVLEKLRD